MSYVPIHDRPPYFANLPSPVSRDLHRASTPGYAAPDIDPSLPWHVIDGTNPAGEMSDEEFDPDLSEEEYGDGGRGGEYAQRAALPPGRNAVASASTSRADRAAPDTPPSFAKHTQYGGSNHHTAQAAEEAESSSRKRRRVSQDAAPNGQPQHTNGQQPQPDAHARPSHPQHHPSQFRMVPSFFNMTARDPVVRAIGDFILNAAEGRDNVEIEFKLGSILNPVQMDARGEKQQLRVRLPGLTEVLLPMDYPVHQFESHMSKLQHTNLNKLLNSYVELSAKPPAPGELAPFPIRYKRQRQTDEFYQYNGQQRSGKIRLSRDTTTGEVLEVIRKKRYADLNVANSAEAFDFRVSLSTEEPCELPPEMVKKYSRVKDRLSYKHQFFQVDLTGVESPQWVEEGVDPATGRTFPAHSKTIRTFELEIEILDAARLIQEGRKEQLGQPNIFDDILMSVLHTVRIIIRNANHPPQSK